jgi:hypothetical protein
MRSTKTCPKVAKPAEETGEEETKLRGWQEFGSDGLLR